MKKFSLYLLISVTGFLMISCSGLKYLTVETREPAQVNLPEEIMRITVVNNVVQQPDDIGHGLLKLGRSSKEREKASSDSVAVFYTEALTQFLNEADYFLRVTYYNKPLRDDSDFFMEQALSPERMNAIRSETRADAIISLDKLIIETDKREHFRQMGYSYSDLTGRIHSIIRVYLPTMNGKIPAVQYNDSLYWEGFDIQDDKAYSEVTLPSREEAMKILAVHAAEKMSNVFAPHWEMQDRWYYTMSNTLMREGENFAKGADWENAILKWESFYNSQSNRVSKAKAASNIALAYEMSDNMEKALEWAREANKLFNESTSPNSLERKRSQLYMNEIERRQSTTNTLDLRND
ncbi:MAG: DUF6340 family protein [Fermentimonas sp.]|nr:DUF6340 family protein [Fermentimonas sp.]MDD4698229.1 DUF6340 family protein [Fermentimonas sp.]